MSTVYTRHPAGYPVTVYGVCRAGDGWAVTSDVWHTLTSHDGVRRGDARYGTREDAITAAQRQAGQCGGEVQA